MLERAGRLGLRDTEVHPLARELPALAIRGAEALGADYVGAGHVEAASAYFARALDGS